MLSDFKQETLEEVCDQVLRNAYKVFKHKPEIKTEEKFTDWKDTFAIFPHRSTYTDKWLWGPVYKRTKTTEKFLVIEGRRIRGSIGGMLQRGLGTPIVETQYASGPEIFYETLKRSGNEI